MDNIKSLLNRFMENASRQMDCEKGTLFMYDKKSKELWTAVLQHDQIAEIRVESNQGLVGHAFTNKEIINIKDAYQDPRFNQNVDAKSGYKTRTVLCMPVMDRSGNCVGVAQMLNKIGNNPFSKEDETLLAKVVQDIADTMEKSGRLINLLPGMVVVVMVMILGVSLHTLLPDAWQKAVSNVLFVILIGMLINNLKILPISFIPGIRFAMRQLLRISIMLMGTKLMLSDLYGVGGKALGLILLLIIVSFFVSHLLGKLMNVPVRLATLIAAGTAICGGSAIAAMAPVIKARDEDFSFAIAANTLLGTFAVFLMPILGVHLGLTDADFGTWAGTSVNDTAQVVAAGYSFSVESGDIATIIKLTRNTLMAVMVVVVGVVYSKWVGGQIGGKKISWTKRARESVPDFVIGFLALAMLNTLGVFTWLSTWSGIDVPHLLSSTTKILILTSLASIGLSTSLAKMRRVGSTPLILAFATYFAVASVSIGLIMLFGAASF